MIKTETWSIIHFAPESENTELKGKKLMMHCAHKIANGELLTASEANAVRWFIEAQTD